MFGGKVTVKISVFLFFSRLQGSPPKTKPDKGTDMLTSLAPIHSNTIAFFWHLSVRFLERWEKKNVTT